MNARNRIPRRHRCLAAAALMACWAGAVGPAGGVDDGHLEMLEQEAFRAAADRVAPSVVRIETVGGLERVGRVLFGTGPTTGLVLDKDGYIVSSAFSFAARPSSILVRLPDETLKPARLVATDHNRMLVLLKIDVDEPLPVPEIVSAAEMRVGQWAIAVGRTFDGNHPNVSVGILSALGRVWGKALQTDAAVSPNNYGGPLIDIRGRVLGVLVPLSPQSAEQVAGAEWYDSGIGFAVEAEHILKTLPRLKNGEDLYPGLMGVNFRGRNPSIAEPVIAACRPNSPAAKAGLKPGDRIVEIDGRQVARAAGVKEALSRRYAGAKVRVAAMRNQQRLEYEIELIAELPPPECPFVGILPMRSVNGGPGVTVRYVFPGSPAAAAGIESGDVVLSLAGEAVGDRNDLLQRVAAFQPGEDVQLKVRSGGQTRHVELKLARLSEDLPPEELPPARERPRQQRLPRVLSQLARALVRPVHLETARGLFVHAASWLRGLPLPPGLAELAGPGGRGPQLGVFPVKTAGVSNEAWAYVPESYDASVSYGVVVWLHAPGEFDWDELLACWRPRCDRDDLILLAPKSLHEERWSSEDEAAVGRLLDRVCSTYQIDSARIVVHGHREGGAAACRVAFRNRRLVRGVAAVDAPLSGGPPQNDPLHRLMVYVATASKSAHASAVVRGVNLLREKKIPVTLKDLGQQPRYLNQDELAELVRWIDMLDRI